MSIVRRILLAILVLSIAPAAQATAQVPDLLIVDGKEFALNTNPLESQLEQKQWKPPEEAMTSTANWRGYVATWEVKEGKLFLKEVAIMVSDPKSDGKYRRKVITSDLYPDVPEVHAAWYTGALIVPDGNMTEYVHMGYGSSFDHYQVFRVRAGQVIERLSMTDAQFGAYKEKKFAEFRKTETYKKAYADFLKEAPDLGETHAIGFIKAYFAETYLSQ